MTRKERFREAVRLFSEKMPSPRTELCYDTPFHLLLAVILSAQCTDKRVNMITPALFAAYPTPASLASASEEEVKEYIKSVTYPNAKSRHLIRAARTIEERFGGELPSDIDSLMELPGVGRKTANVMLAVAGGKAAMPVDTHVFRVAERIGLTTRSKTPLATEKVLVANFPEEVLTDAHHWLILHGRYVCKARKPDCGVCFLTGICRFHSLAIKKQSKTDKTLKNT